MSSNVIKNLTSPSIDRVQVRYLLWTH